MSNYFIVIVPPDWTPDMAVGLSEATLNRFDDRIESGLRVLIFKPSPVNAIVPEGEVFDNNAIQRLDEWPGVNVRQRPLTGMGARADCVLPVRILYQRAEANAVPLLRVREWVGDPLFPRDEWTFIERETYDELTNWP
jgi:hypothetical protein